MRKYSSQTQKARFSLSLLWMPMTLAFAIVVLIVGMWVIGHSQPSTANTGNTTIAPAVTTTSNAGPTRGMTVDSQPTTGVFALSAGGPIPVAANVLHPTNIARIVRKNELMTIYAGSLAHAPSTGVLAILQENLTTGQQSLHLYQTAQPVHALTILSIHQDMLILSSPTTKGSFDLIRDQFHFS
jgi:hypothetical protein